MCEAQPSTTDDYDDDDRNRDRMTGNKSNNNKYVPQLGSHEPSAHLDIKWNFNSAPTPTPTRLESVSTRSMPQCACPQADDDRRKQAAWQGEPAATQKGRFGFCLVVVDILKYRENTWAPISKRYLKEIL